MKTYNSEIVFRGHPDKLADQISDSILMEFISKDNNSVVNIDVVGGANTIFVTGKISSSVNVDINSSIRKVLLDIGHRTNMEIVNEISINKLSDESEYILTEPIEVNGYACNETPQLLPKIVVILQELSKSYSELCKSDKRFLSDGKARLTCIYDENNMLVKIKDANINYQNTEVNLSCTNEKLFKELFKLLNKMDVECEDYKLNPYGNYLTGGFDRDTGLTGVKLLEDNYHGFSMNNKSFSGKDINGVNRCGAYKARQLAKRILKDNNLSWCEVKLVYDNQKGGPKAIQVNSNIGPIKVDSHIYEECIPSVIVEDLGLLKLDYVNLSAFGHFQ